MGMYRYRMVARNLFIFGSLVPILLCLIPPPVLSDMPDSMAECPKIQNEAERRRCYDQLVGRKLPENATGIGTAEKAPEEKAAKVSFLSRLWQLDEESRGDRYAITPYRSNYILPFTYNNSPNNDAVREADPEADLKKAEVKFQLSIKFKLWQDIFGQEMDLWFGYTQQSFWQFYDFADSSPFRETDYEPELLLNFRTHYSILGWKGRFINVGLNHQSNGRSKPLSRSWNRIVANVGFERENLVLFIKGWYRIPEDPEDDDNPNMEDYLGYNEIQAYYFLKKHRFGLMLRNNLDFHDNRGGLQLEWSFPIIAPVDGYVQYFNGYGESLLDYNHSTNRIGIGFIWAEWD